MNTELPGRDGDKTQARMRTRNDRKAGKVPSPDSLPCADCGSSWATGKPHHQYDHHLGYDAKHHRDIQAVCPKCHIGRELAREAALGAVSVRGARLETKHPGAKKIRQVDGSIARFAAKHKVAATTVRSWYATGEAAREIPARFANLLAAKPYEVPLAAWRNGIGE